MPSVTVAFSFAMYQHRSAPAVDRRLARRLRAGDYAIEAELDLHGRTREEAERAVDSFLERERAQGHRCLLLIHGRGLNSGAEGPVLGEVVKARLGSRDNSAAHMPVQLIFPPWMSVSGRCPPGCAAAAQPR